MADASYGSLPFAEQIAFFRRKLNLPTNAWTDAWQQAHDHAFVVAGANRMAMVADFREAVEKAIAGGTTLAEFRKDFDAIVAKYGWDYNGGRNWRSRVIYETNLRTSYAAGRYTQLQSIKAVRPFWQYVHSDAVVHPRPLHRAWGAKPVILHADDPWWKTHYPPNGWGCQCSVRALSERDLNKLGVKLEPAPAEDMQQVTVGQRGGTPRTIETPAGVDPGFGYAPGADAWARQWVNRSAEAQAAVGAQRWEQVITSTFADVGQPPRLPFAALPEGVTLAAPAASEFEMADRLRGVLGAPVRVFDVKGLPVVVDADWLAAHAVDDLNRAMFAPLLPDLLEQPQEVWLQVERQAESGLTRASAVLVKSYDIGRGKSLRFVARVQSDGSLLSWTVYPTSGVKEINRARVGALWWPRP